MTVSYTEELVMTTQGILYSKGKGLQIPQHLLQLLVIILLLAMLQALTFMFRLQYSLCECLLLINRQVCWACPSAEKTLNLAEIAYSNGRAGKSSFLREMWLEFLDFHPTRQRYECLGGEGWGCPAGCIR